MTPSQGLYDTLLRIPLFMGMSQSDLLDIATRTRFSFHKIDPRSRLQKEDQLCTRLTMILGGTAAMTEWANGRAYSVTEEIDGPFVIEPERLFGIRNRYAKTVTAVSVCNVLTLDKTEMTRLIDNYSVFRINLFNLISTNMQRELRLKWRTEPVELYDRVIKFFETHCTYPAGVKHFNIKMTQLATEMNVSRRAVSAVLNLMQDRGLVALRRAGIDIHSLEKMHENHG